MPFNSRIVALDLSLTSTGVAAIEEGEVFTYSLRPGAKAKGAPRLAGLRDWVGMFTAPAHLVPIEGYSYNSRNGGERLGELGGVVRVALYEAGIPYLEVSPAAVKKYATGKGNASKEQVYGAAVHRAGREFATTDEADAWWLLQMALAHYGLPHIPMPKTHTAVLAQIDWPTLTLEVPA